MIEIEIDLIFGILSSKSHRDLVAKKRDRSDPETAPNPPISATHFRQKVANFGKLSSKSHRDLVAKKRDRSDPESSMNHQ